MTTRFLAAALVLTAGGAAVSAPSIDTGDTYSPTGTEPSNLTVRQGALTEVDVSITTEADSWSGVIGNASGGLSVGDSGGNALFSWGRLDAKYVYFDTDSINFSADWENASTGNISSEFPFVENGTDSVEETFTETENLSSGTQSTSFNTTAAFTRNSTGDEYFPTMYALDGEDGFFAAEVRPGEGFNGRKADFQAILPENGADSQPTEYRVFVELE